MHPPTDDAVSARYTQLPSWLLSQAAAHSHRLIVERMAEVGGRGYDYRLLATLDEFGPASQAALGRRSGIHFSDVVAALNQLADRKLIERAIDPADRRRNVITLTPTGRRQLKRLEKQLTVVQDELLDPLSAQERDQLTGLLTRILERRSPRRPAP
jgi:DNA-binding MarR family transcriptional regulator